MKIGFSVSVGINKLNRVSVFLKTRLDYCYHFIKSRKKVSGMTNICSMCSMALSLVFFIMHVKGTTLLQSYTLDVPVILFVYYPNPQRNSVLSGCCLIRAHQHMHNN